MPKLRIDLPEDAYARLEELALREYRTADMQATWLLMQILREMSEKAAMMQAPLPLPEAPSWVQRADHQDTYHGT